MKYLGVDSDNFICVLDEGNEEKERIKTNETSLSEKVRFFACISFL